MIEDQVLIDGCLSGDKKSWDVFVERFSKLIYWSIRQAFTGSAFHERAELTDEVFQEVFARLLEREELVRLRESKSIRRFLSVMAGNMTLNKVRSIARAEKRMFSIDEDVAPAVTGSTAERNEKDVLVAEVVDALAEREQRCLELHYLDGKTQSQISEILGLPQTTVANVIWRTRERLRARLIEKGFDAEG